MPLNLIIKLLIADLWQESMGNALKIAIELLLIAALQTLLGVICIQIIRVIVKIPQIIRILIEKRVIIVNKQMSEYKK
jgi:hypothetical protein